MDKKAMEKGKRIVESYTRNVTLKVFHFGCDSRNFDILKMLGSASKGLSSKDLLKSFNLNKAQLGRRVSDLDKAGLLKKCKLGLIRKSGMTEPFLKVIGDMQKEVFNILPELI